MKKKIKHPRDVYPYCSGEFASGVRAFLRKEEYPAHPESKEKIQGYICAERDLKDDYELSDGQPPFIKLDRKIEIEGLII